VPSAQADTVLIFWVMFGADLTATSGFAFALTRK
jgi:hypothetical protein